MVRKKSYQASEIENEPAKTLGFRPVSYLAQ